MLLRLRPTYVLLCEQQGDTELNKQITCSSVRRFSKQYHRLSPVTVQNVQKLCIHANDRISRVPECPGAQIHIRKSHRSKLFLCMESPLFASPMLPHALSALFIFITELVPRAKGQTTCEPLVHALVRQAEAMNSYGSWDACCARTGVDCFLSRLVVPPGFEPCDVTHGARAGCNRLAQGTVCMLEEDGLISGSPCGASVIRTCGSVIALGDGVAAPFDPSSDLEATFGSILARGMLGSQLCCSTSVCTFASPCTSQYNMSACVSDDVNSICMPLDQPDNTTYAALIVQDGHNCTATSTSLPTGGAVPTKKGGGNTAIIGGSVGGAIAIVCIAVLSIFLCMRKRGRNHDPRTRTVPSNELPGQQETAATIHVSSFSNVPGARSTSEHTPSFPSHPGLKMTSATGTLPLLPGPSHQNQNPFEIPANPQNPSQVHTNIISRPSHRSQNILEFPANSLRVYQNPGASTINPPVFPSTVMDTPAMEARIAALENQIVALSGPLSGVQVEGSRRGAAKAGSEADSPRYHDLE